MMKLKVVDNYTKAVEIEAYTIDALKARIMECFSLKEEDLRNRLLVPDGRDLSISRSFNFASTMVEGFDLLQLKAGSILEDKFCNDCLSDGYTLLLGWKGPFIVCFNNFPDLRSSVNTRSTVIDCISISIKVRDSYVTLGELKKKMETKMRRPLTSEDIPRILWEGGDNKPLIFFGFYSYYKDPLRPEMVTFYINPSRTYSDPERMEREDYIFSGCYFRTEPATPRYFGEKYDREKESKKFKVSKEDQYGNTLLVPFTMTMKRRSKTKRKMIKVSKRYAARPYKLFQMSDKERREDERNFIRKLRNGRVKMC